MKSLCEDWFPLKENIKIITIEYRKWIYMWVGWVWEYNCTVNVLTLNIYNPNQWLWDSVLQCHMRNRTNSGMWSGSVVKYHLCHLSYRESHVLRYVCYVLQRAMQSDLVTHAQIIHIELSFTPWDWSPGDPTPCPSVYLADITPAWCLMSGRAGSLCLGAPGHGALFEFCWPGCG